MFLYKDFPEEMTIDLGFESRVAANTVRMERKTI
jgi:hypothetical protein